MKPLKEEIVEYIQDPYAPYAVLLTGEWGSGKTHFWHHELLPAIKEVIGKNHNVHYLSLFGIASAEDMEMQIFLCSNRALASSKTQALADMVSTAASALIDSSRLDKLARGIIKNFKPPKDALFCFDDLERSSIPAKSLLGVLNHLIEHNRNKIILIANEERLAEKKDFSEYKEKLVGRIYNYQPNYESVLDSVLKEHFVNAPILELMNVLKKSVVSIFRLSKTDNVRSLLKGISATNRLYKLLKGKNSQECERLMCLCTPISFSYLFEADASNKDIESIKKGLVKGRFNSRLNYLLKGDKKQESKPYEQHLSKYHLESILAEAIPDFVLDLFANGYTDEEALYEQIKNVLSSYSNEPNIFQKLQNFRDLSDGDFADVCSKVMDELKEGNVKDVTTIISLYTQFRFFARNKFIDKNEQTINSIFEDLIRGGFERNTLIHTDDLETKINHMFQNGDKIKAFKNLKDLAIGMNKQAIYEDRKAKAKEAFDYLPEDFEKFIKFFQLGHESSFFRLPALTHIDQDDFAKKIIAMSPMDLAQFSDFIEIRYNDIGAYPDLKKEKNTLEIIRKHIKEHLKNIKPSLTRGILSDLDRVVSEALEKISRYSQDESNQHPKFVKKINKDVQNA